MKKYPKYLKKIMIFGLVLVLLPIIALGVFSSYMSSDIIKSKVVDGNMQIMVQTKMRVEQSLKTVDSTIVPFLNSAVLTKAISQPYQPYNFEMYDELSKSLYSLQSNNLSFYNVHFVNLKNRWVLNINGLFKFDNFQNTDIIFNYANYEKTSFWIREDRDIKNPGIIDGYSTINGVSIVKKIPINALNAEGMVIVQIRQAELDKLINKSDLLGDVMIVDASSCVLQSENDEMRGKDISFLPYIQKAQKAGQSDGYFEMPVDGDMKVITFSKSQYNDWLYLSIVSKKFVLREARSILYVNLLICVVILVLLGALAVFMSRRIYRPIGKIYSFIKEDNGGNETSDEIEFIGKSLSSLVTDNLRMAGQLHDTEQQLEEALVKKLLISENVDSIKTKLDIFPHLSSWKYMSVISINIFDFALVSYEIKDKNLVLFAISNVVSDIIPQGQRLCPVIIDDYVSVLVGGGFELVDIFKKHIGSLVSTIQENLLMHVGIKVDIGISRPFNRIDLSNQAFNESKEALKYRFRSENETSIFFDDVQDGITAEVGLSKPDGESIVEAIKLGNKTKASLLLHEFVEDIVTSHTSVNKYQVLLVRLIIDIINILPKEEPAPIDNFINGKTFLDNINALKNSHQAEEWIMNNIINPVIDKVFEYRKTQEKKISKRIIEMIESDYDKDLDLVVCAEKLHYNPNYIRRIFSEETGTTFSEYLLNYRLNIAKKWLVETDMKINEIAEKLRYNNPQNFIRSFRKKEGVTPGEYRSENCKFFKE